MERFEDETLARYAGANVTTTVHSIGGRSEEVTGEVVGGRRGRLAVKTACHGTIMVAPGEAEIVIVTDDETLARLEELRAVLRAECISYGELFELQSLAAQIPAGDIELLEAAGVPEDDPRVR